ncbi:MAG: SAM-dependent methyltransferase [Clostridia bacterium]|nr:SAM-dependent methyltransferase [Clostridia bacterium]
MICDGLDKRLLSVAELVRQGAVFADIGTDHAYLPLFLLKAGRISRAFCSDINKGPLESARRNTADAGFTDSVSFMLTDGAAALAGNGITDYAICGMGGELIADIIDRAPQLKTQGVNLILQPMTKQEHLRAYLASHGFKILCESYSEDSGKYYVAMLATYTGECAELSELDAALPARSTEILGLIYEIKYLKTKIKAYTRAAEGKRLGGEPYAREDKLIESASARLRYIESLLCS